MEKSELLLELKQLLDDGLIDHNEYELLKKKIVFELNKEKKTTTISDNTTQQISNKKKNTNSNNRRIAIFIISLLFVIGGAYIVLYSGIFEKDKTQTEAKEDVDYQELEEEKNNHDNLQEEEEENKETIPIPVSETPPPVSTGETTVVFVDEEIIDFPDVEASFPGGSAEMIKFINSNIKYPQTSIEMNEKGRVYLSFIVEPDGSITNIAVERGVSADLDREAKRLVRQMPRWVPGEAKGKKVRSRCRLPINFSLN
jgi:protein TonB